MKTSETIKTIMPYFVKALGQIKSVKKDRKNEFLKSSYATLDAIIEVVRPVLSENKLSFIQAVNNEGVETIILHESGEWISSGTLLIETDPPKGITLAQSKGITITYAKRYQLGSLLGISTDEDTDGVHPREKKQPEKKDGKPVLTPNDPAWPRAIKHMSNGGSIEEIEKKFTVTDEIREKLLNPDK